MDIAVISILEADVLFPQMDERTTDEEKIRKIGMN
jgi:hypothetical protein